MTILVVPPVPRTAASRRMDGPQHQLEGLQTHAQAGQAQDFPAVDQPGDENRCSKNTMRCAGTAAHFVRPRARPHARPTTFRDRFCARTVCSQWKSMDPTAPKRGRGRPVVDAAGGPRPPPGPVPARAAPLALTGLTIRPAHVLGAPASPAAGLPQLQPARPPPRPALLHGVQSRPYPTADIS